MATEKRSSIEGLSAPLLSALDDHLSKVRLQIIDRAHDLAQQAQNSIGSPGGGDVQATLSDLTLATDEVTRGRSVESLSRWTRFFQLFPPFTCVCTLLCIAFAGLGLWAIRPGSGGGSGTAAKYTSGFLDIAKIFAGAIVGSTASGVVSAARTRRSGSPT